MPLERFTPVGVVSMTSMVAISPRGTVPPAGSGMAMPSSASTEENTSTASTGTALSAPATEPAGRMTLFARSTEAIASKLRPRSSNASRSTATLTC